MKVILSRKGFDSKAGGVANPILPDGTLLPLPIPAKADELTYSDLHYDGVSYADILAQLKPKDKKIRNWHCHLDPDLRPETRINLPLNWQAGFGQIDSAQSYLRNQGVGVGDLFLFFGWFKQTEGNLKDGSLRYVKGAPDLHLIYGYIQIGETVSDREMLKANYSWHPHAIEKRANSNRNMLYLPSQELSFRPDLKGHGVFHFDSKRILTKEGCSKATWKIIEALKPENVCRNIKNSATNNDGLYYKGQWQEMVLQENSLSEEWMRSLF